MFTNPISTSLTRWMMLAMLLLAAPLARSADGKSVVRGNTAFALKLYSQLRTNSGNLFFSPYSVSTALAMTYAGARGETAQQMSRALHFAPDQKPFHAAFGQLLRQQATNTSAEIYMANALWSARGHPFRAAFLDLARRQYQANINQADFVTQAEAARRQINNWVQQQTRSRIKEVLAPGSISAQTRLILANAIYFKGTWDHPFKKSATSPQPFHLSPTRQANVPLMHQTDHILYMADADFQAATIHYRNDDFYMLILLPRQIDGLSKLEKRLTPAWLQDVRDKMHYDKVEVFLPRFTLEYSFSLHDPLARMDMPNAFGATSDFSGIDGTRNLKLTDVFHKAWVEVNESGTEAAATAIAITQSKSEGPPPVFRANHPFLFFIRDNQTDSLLFLGRYAGPTQ